MKLTRHSRLAATATMGALALTLAACGSDNATGDAATDGGATGSLSGELNGAGSSAQESAMSAWRAGFQASYPDVTVNYDPVGSGGGRTQFLDGSVAFGGSDAALGEDELAQATERCFGSAAMDLPIYISPIAVVFNLPGISELNLSAETIAMIFDGAITSWDDPAIAADNAGVELPALAITPVHRSDESGTTKNFTDYLNQAANGAWAYDASGDWPVSGGESAQGTSGVVQAVQSGEGAITYADASKAGDLGTVSVKVGDTFTAPTEEAAATALDVSQRDETRGENDIVIDIDRTTTEAGAYPLILVSYLIACEQYDSQTDVDNVKAFLTYVASAEGQAASESAAGSAPISDALRAEVQAGIDSISLAS
ncbi:phosphate ABC transporter substrate-binding protein PstS [Actinotalea sp.]|uniref:phosphate ABC transporter substrate-binding protein PstS n=1 Tax=Actinotalea sp. TaxID=1872145 RepID=UPI003569377A